MMTGSKPTLCSFNGVAIPQALKDNARWAPWRAVWNSKRQKYDKIPHRADSAGYGISTAKPDQWFSYDAALIAYQRNPAMFAGLGYVMTGPHGVVGTDLDNCVVDGVIAPWAADVVAQLDSYTEISPSGKGLRILSLGELTSDWCNHDIGIEIYGGNEARFLTVTGAHVAGTPTDVRPAPDGVLTSLEARYAKERRKAEVIDLHMPEVLDELLVPSVDTLDLPYSARDFLETGTHRGDRSGELFAAAVALYTAGLADDDVFSLLVHNQYAMEIALDHRRQDHDRASLYLWREHCCKGRARAAPRSASADEFDVVVDVAPTTPKPARFRVLPATEFLQRKPASWIVKGLLPRADLVVVFGESGSGKTFFVLDLVGAVARGIAWRGRKVTQGRVVYICAEGANGFRNRLDAYARHNGIDAVELDIGVIADAPNFMEKADIKDLLAALTAFGKTDVIVVDTFAQVMPGANENSGEDVGRALAHCKVLHKVTGAAVMLIHHSGKDASRGARGWSGLRAAADAEIEIARAGDDRAAILTKLKDGEDGAEFGFKLLTVMISEDEEGEAITSCVVEHTEVVPKAQRPREAKGSKEKVVLKVARELTELCPESVKVTELIDAAVNQIPFDQADGKRDNRRRDVLRAIESLGLSNHLSTEGGVVVVL